jgi:hypothetical protein
VKGVRRLVTRQGVVWPLILISFLWGIMLNGFFLYVPYVADLSDFTDSEVITGVGWLIFSLIAVGVGRAHSTLANRQSVRALVGALVVLLSVPALVFQDALGPWSWLFLSIPLSLTLSMHISRLVSNSEPSSIPGLSAWLGASPLLGLLVVSAAFSLDSVRGAYPLIAAVTVGVAMAAALVEPGQGGDSSQEKHQARIGRGSLLTYGFLLGLGVALVNSYVFERIAEVTESDSNEVARLGSLLVLLSSLVGVVASLLAGARFVQRVPRVVLARLAAVTISLGVTVLLLAPTIPLVALAGILVGVGFGFTNGLELRLVHAASLGPAQRTALFGQFLAATTIPYVVASVVGLQLGVIVPGTTPVLLVALVAAALAAVTLRKKEAAGVPTTQLTPIR